MSRLMSVTLTEQAVVDRTKTVTRRLGWLNLRPGTRLTLCRKVMGRKRKDGTVEPLVRLAEVEVVDVYREHLCAITVDDVKREGFSIADGVGGWMARDAFIAMFCKHMGCAPERVVTRIEWRYLDSEGGEADLTTAQP